MGCKDSMVILYIHFHTVCSHDSFTYSIDLLTSNINNINIIRLTIIDELLL
jgi:hypothetical protein